MADYIDRKNYCENFCCCCHEFCDKDKCNLFKVPFEDVAPIKHGKWEYDSSYDVCSLCGFVNGFDEEFTYCPGCGAKMDGKDNKHI